MYKIASASTGYQSKLKPLMWFAATVLLFSPTRLVLAQEPLGSWSPITTSNSIIPIHLALLPTGKVIFYDNSRNFQILDPVTQAITGIPSPWYNSFCGSMSMLPDGRLFMSGGGGGETSQAVRNAAIYDPFLNLYAPVADMFAMRWYNTSITLPTGEVLSSAGTTPLAFQEVYDPTANTWRRLSKLPDPTYYFPRLFVAPNGFVFNAGPDNETAYLDISGQGDSIFVADTIAGTRDKGGAVMYDDGKLLAVGGALSASAVAHNSAETIDLNNPSPTWEPTSPMTYRRKDLTLVIEPNGKILAIGGNSGPGKTADVMPIEEWNPADGRWRILPSIGVARPYHSTSLLLPDGRIISAGGGKSSYQLYTPGYLLNGPRPTVTYAPTILTLGQSFSIESPIDDHVTTVNMIRMSTTTHAVNFDQRILRLPFERTADKLSMTLASNPNVAIPGYYMLFALNAQGVPSIARIIKVQMQDVAPPTLLTTRVSSPTRLRLHWTDNSRNEAGYVVSRSNDGVQFIDIATLPANSLGYMDYRVAAGTTIYYTVSAVDANGSRHTVGPVVAITPTLNAPETPGILTAKPGSDSSVILAWRDSDDLEDQFIIERSEDSNSFTFLDAVPFDTITYSDSTAIPGIAYYYRVYSTNSAGRSNPSAVVRILLNPALSNLTLSPARVAGGVFATGTVSLVGAAGSETTVSLRSSMPEAHVPSSITIPTGLTSATFTIATDSVTKAKVCDITATITGSIKTVTLTVAPVTFSSLTLSSGTITGGLTITGTVAFESAVPSDTTVVLKSANSAATVPPSVVVPAGSATARFNITTDPVVANSSGPISASFGSINKTTNLTLKPAVLTSLALSSTSVLGGAIITGTVNFTTAVGVDTSVDLSTANSAAHVLTSVVVPGGSSSADFVIATDPVQVNTTGSISAKFGIVTKSANLMIKAPTYTSFSLAPNPVVGGHVVIGTVTMSGPVAVDTPVELTNTNPKAVLPGPTVIIRAGSASVSFDVSTRPTGSTATGNVKAMVGSAAKSVTLRITP